MTSLSLLAGRTVKKNDECSRFQCFHLFQNAAVYRTCSVHTFSGSSYLGILSQGTELLFESHCAGFKGMNKNPLTTCWIQREGAGVWILLERYKFLYVVLKNWHGTPLETSGPLRITGAESLEKQLDP